MNMPLSESAQRLLDLLRRYGAMSRADLARKSELAAPTLTRLAQQLLDRGLVLETHKVRDGQRGKPAQLVKLNPTGAFALGIALQSEYLAGCIVDMEGNQYASITRAFHAPDPALVARLAPKLLTDLLEDAAIPHDRLIGAGISMPGMALGSYGAGIAPEGQNDLPDEFAAWRGVNLKDYFQKCLGMASWLENSSRAAALAELYYGAGQRLSHFAVLHIAYGFGGGLILDRKPYRGALGRAGEFGGMFPYTGIRPSGRDLVLFLSDKMPAAPTHIRDLMQRPLPPPLVQEWVERVYPGLHELSRSLAITLDLEAIILNGLVPVSVLSVMAQMLRERLPKSIPAGFGTPDIAVSRLSDSGLGMGAASLPFHFMSSGPSR